MMTNNVQLNLVELRSIASRLRRNREARMLPWVIIAAMPSVSGAVACSSFTPRGKQRSDATTCRSRPHSVPDEIDVDVDVAAHRIQGRTYLMCFVHDDLRLVTRQVGQRHLDGDRELESAVLVAAEVDLRAHGGIVDSGFCLPADQAQRRMEARRVSCRKQLLGIRALAATTQFLGDRQMHVDLAVSGAGLAVAAVAGRERL